jgi:CDP-6-deoxy-D-xylo-4-hexulose-3-dehydrase
VDRRVLYATAVYDQEEIGAVLEVLNDGAGTLRIGKRVAEMERRVAELFGKSGGVMCNSGSSALYLAVELLDLEPGAEVITSPLTFSTDLAPLVRAGLVPVFVDVEPDTFNVDVTAIEEMVGPATKAILLPNLAGNAPDWDHVRAVADRHGLAVIEDSCDALGATLRGSPTGTRADISVTSFALSHIITCAGNGGMVLLDDERRRDRCLSLRRWGRRSVPQLFGSRRGERSFWEDLDGIRYDSLFIFDDVAWNFEPSELGAAFGLRQLDKLPDNYARRQRNFALYNDFLAQHPSLSSRRASSRTSRPRGCPTSSSSTRTPASSARTSSSSSSRAGSTPARSGPETPPASRCCAACRSANPTVGSRTPTQ